MEIFNLIGITKSEMEQYEIMYKNFHNYTIGKALTSEIIYNNIHGRCIDINTLGEYASKQLENSVQVFYDYGNGFSESNSTKLNLEPDRNGKFNLKIDVNDHIKGLRIDPANDCCIIFIEKLNGYKNGYYNIEYTTNGNIIDNSIVIFNTVDPQIYVNYIDKYTSSVEFVFIVKEVASLLALNLNYAIHNNKQDTERNYLRQFTNLEQQIINLEEQISKLNLQIYSDKISKEELIKQLIEEINQDKVVFEEKESLINQLIGEINQDKVAFEEKESLINQLREEVIQNKKVIEEKDNHINNKNVRYYLLEKENEKNIALYNEIVNSKCWRSTKPLRKLCDLIKFNKYISLFIKFLLSLKNSGIKYTFIKIIKRIFKNDSILYKLNMINFKKVISFSKIFGIKSTIKKIKEKLITKENSVDSIEYVFSERIIPKGWMEIQRYKPRISIIIPVINADIRKMYLESALESLDIQTYKNFEICISGNESDLNIINKIIEEHKLLRIIKNIVEVNDKIKSINSALDKCSGELVCVLEQEDLLIKNALFLCVEQFNINRKAKIVFCGDDCFSLEGQYCSPDDKTDIIYDKKFSVDRCLHFCMIKYNEIEEFSFNNFVSSLDNISDNEFCVVNDICYHYRICENLWDSDNKIKPIAFYLPQFHRVKQNDEWWGEGFTEWTNVKRTYQMFDNHYQQREPGQLGYYNLIEQEDLQQQQIDLAQKYNLYGFCYYYYWFDGDRLLEKPMDKFIADQSLNFPFCICWANENWTRRWDGLENEILMKQNYGDNWGEHLFKDILHLIKDSRYIKVNGSPLILIYKPHLISNLVENIEHIRKLAKINGIEKLCIAVVKHPETKDPTEYGADVMVEFPPHGFSHKDITDDVINLKKGFSGRIYDYKYAAYNFVKLKAEKYTFFRSSMLAWDNTARKLDNAYIFHNFSLEDFKLWLYQDIRYTKRFNGDKEQMIFINAWNEWSEGTYLEPDKKYGIKYLETLNEALKLR